MMEIDEYDYNLPEHLIAQEPLPQRVDSRLLVVDREQDSLSHSHFRSLPDFLRPNDCLVLNNTRVLPARLTGIRAATGGKWSGLFLESDPQGAWKVLSKTRGKLKASERIDLYDADGKLQFALTMLQQLDGGAWAVRPVVEGDAETLLARVGHVPLPPYIRGGQMKPSDRDRYQTVFAKEAGAVAAPTAGLHFSDGLLKSIREMGVSIAFTTLHVGGGTFRPISTDSLDEHQMHSEWGEVAEADVATIQATQERGGRVIAVGTTGVRVLETAAQSGDLQPWAGETELFIRPGFQFNAVDALITNFHLPKSTLLVLVSAMAGRELILEAYAKAVENEYRFFSYGDAMLIV